MEFNDTGLAGLMMLKPKVFEDDRGFFMETYRETTFQEAGLNKPFVQANHSGSKQGVLRGLHYQIQHSQGKLVRVISGQVFDVAVDLRRSSTTFGSWTGIELSAENKCQLWIPPGFAHGFYVMSKWADVLYQVTDYWSPKWERTLRWNDPDIGIIWPLSENQEPIVSIKDMQGVLLSEMPTEDLFV